MPTVPKDWIPASTVATHYGVDYNTVGAWIRRGCIKPIQRRKIGMMWFIDPVVLESRPSRKYTKTTS